MHPFDDLRAALNSPPDDLEQQVRADVTRPRRTGTPEIVYAPGKSLEHVLSAVEALIQRSGRVIVSRVADVAELTAALSPTWRFVLEPGSRSGTVVRENAEAPHTGGRVAVVSAGTSDIPVAAEAALVCREMGCDVRTAWDLGVAGIHRLVRPLESLLEWDADVIVVAAGMDGILPTIVSGLVPQPIVALPVSTGYGFGGQGMGALTTMLQTCSPGLAVVNIDNGIGAGVTAARIANRVAAARLSGGR